MSLKIEELNSVLTEAGLDLATRQKAIKIAEELELEKKEDRAANKAPKTKNEYLVLVRGDAALAKILQEAWVLQVNPDDDVNSLVSRLKVAAHEQNNAGKRKKGLIKTFRDLFLYAKRIHTKAQNFHVKSKQAVRVIVLDSENI